MNAILHALALYGFIAPWVAVFWLGIILSRWFIRDLGKLIRLYTRRPGRPA